MNPEAWFAKSMRETLRPIVSPQGWVSGSPNFEASPRFRTRSPKGLVLCSGSSSDSKMWAAFFNPTTSSPVTPWRFPAPWKQVSLILNAEPKAVSCHQASRNSSVHALRRLSVFTFEKTPPVTSKKKTRSQTCHAVPSGALKRPT